MTTSSTSKTDRRITQRMSELYSERACLESHAVGTKREIHHLKKAMRVTQERIRSLSAQIRREQRGGSLPRLVYDARYGVIRTNSIRSMQADADSLNEPGMQVGNTL